MAKLDIPTITPSLMEDIWTMCPLKFKAKYIDKSYSGQTSEAMERGNYFETLCIGTGRDGAYVPTDKMKKSVYNQRIADQASKWKDLAKHYNIEVMDVQASLTSTLILDIAGNVIEIEIGGHPDIIGTVDGKPAIIDLKSTGDVTTTYGDYAWGAPEKMKLTQAKHYPLVYKNEKNIDVDFYYPVFDFTPDLGIALYKVEVSPASIENHKMEIFNVWNELVSRYFNGYEATPSYTECSGCPLVCESKVHFPEIKTIVI